MPTYCVNLERSIRSTGTIEIDAENIEAAKQFAIDKSHNIEWLFEKGVVNVQDIRELGADVCHDPR